METTYTMIGADGLQYGPISLEQLRGWIGEGRVTEETKILRSDTNSWLPASSYTELGLQQVAAPPPPPLPPAPSGATIDPMLVRRVMAGARWFYWIAGLFALFGVFAAKGQSWSFMVGIIFYLLDALLLVLVGSWLSAAFHAYVLIWLILGLKSNMQLNSKAR